MDEWSTISKEFEFSYGHMLPHQGGKCVRPHGHNARVVVGVSGTINECPDERTEGMVMDFGDLKNIVKPIIDRLDHRFLVKGDEWIYKAAQEYSLTFDKDDFVVLGFRVTAENLAGWIAEETCMMLATLLFEVTTVHVRFFETPESEAYAVRMVNHGS